MLETLKKRSATLLLISKAQSSNSVKILINASTISFLMEMKSP